ncbi:MAG: APC family permease, partial [Firmicutes bacterium]|nr:APC family permease [Bacillota bacterium]
LVLEFLFDSVTAAVFLARQHPASWPHARDRHRHRGLLAAAILTAAWLLALALLFLRYGAAVLGQGIDAVLGVMLLLGAGFTVLDRRRHPGPESLFIFDPDAVAGP